MKPPSRPKIDIVSNQRVLLVASPNDGKTTKALELLDVLDDGKPMIIVNPGADAKLYKIFGAARHDIDPRWPQVQHIAPPVTDNYKSYKFWWSIAEHGNCRVYIDELDQVGTASQYNHGLKYLYQRGRRRFIQIIASSQRYQNIPVFTVNFSDHFFVGYVTGDDLKKLEKNTGQKWEHLMQQRSQHQFAYWTRNQANQQPYFIN